MFKKTKPFLLLRHPLDHHDKQEFKLTPGKGLLEPPVLNSKLNENYRWAA